MDFAILACYRRFYLFQSCSFQMVVQRIYHQLRFWVELSWVPHDFHVDQDPFQHQGFLGLAYASQTLPTKSALRSFQRRKGLHHSAPLLRHSTHLLRHCFHNCPLHLLHYILKILRWRVVGVQFYTTNKMIRLKENLSTYLILEINDPRVHEYLYEWYSVIWVLF